MEAWSRKSLELAVGKFKQANKPAISQPQLDKKERSHSPHTPPTQSGAHHDEKKEKIAESKAAEENFDEEIENKKTEISQQEIKNQGRTPTIEDQAKIDKLMEAATAEKDSLTVRPADANVRCSMPSSTPTSIENQYSILATTTSGSSWESKVGRNAIVQER